MRVALADNRYMVNRLREATTHWQKFRGLMLDTSLQPDEALLIRRCNSIHCCFMRIPIDVLFLDADGTVLKAIPRMKPWTFSPIVRGARDVLECYPGTIDRFGVGPGDRLTIVPSVR